MAARRLIYSDALQNDHDINIVLQAFGNLHVDPPSTPTATSIISLTDNDSGSDNESPSIISISDSDSEDLLYHFSHDGDDEDMYWSALRDEDNRAFWAEPDASSSPNPTEGGRVSPPPVESDAVSVEDGESSVMSAGDDDERNYLVSVGRETGVLHSWHRAGHASQGVPGGQVRRLVQIVLPHANRGPKVAYVVYEGLIPGIYTRWCDAKAQVTTVPGNVYQGFSSRFEAERAYVVAYAMGCVRSLPRRGSTERQPDPAMPTPAAMLDAFGAVSDDFLEADWHVVFKGKAPGV
ncbi:hypothetical protein FIBSPDRAFT_888829 [Athelia psychrophila]|uniref:Ribonuclease H1 N-terminal domain-containing protein n=1 Tax=Athelia psychrophila TaxID=1759441 RepID=A0A166MVI4_9AGAM|nr:hypothetical protein FIBSPDRAFT_888829 [Fibularhizoctonia sp. CBS 109695]